MQESEVQHQQIAAVVAAEPFKIAGIGDVGDGVFFGLENQAVILHHMHVAYRRGKGNIPHAVSLPGFQIFDAFETFFQVAVQDGVRFDGVPGREKQAVFVETAVGHGFGHDVEVRRMVEVAVGNDNRAQFLRVQLTFGNLHDATRAGVHQDLRAIKIKPEATGGEQLADNHEAGAAGAEKSDCFLRLIYVIHDDSMIRDRALFYKLYEDLLKFVILL